MKPLLNWYSELVLTSKKILYYESIKKKRSKQVFYLFYLNIYTRVVGKSDENNANPNA
jgi:hypothetical protein